MDSFLLEEDKIRGLEALAGRPVWVARVSVESALAPWAIASEAWRARVPWAWYPKEPGHSIALQELLEVERTGLGPACEPEVWQDSGALASLLQVVLASGLPVQLAQEVSALRLPEREASEAFVFQLRVAALAFPSWALVVASAAVVLAAESFEGAVGHRVVEFDYPVEKFVLQAVELLR